MDILYEDADLLAVNKPSGIATIPGRTDPANILAQLTAQLTARDGAPPAKLLVIHRLDQDTSGLLLVAKHPAAQRDLSSQFGRREVRKVYWAIVPGRPAQPEGEIRTGLEPDPRRPGCMKPTRRRSARQAATAWRILERYRGWSLIEARPLTGRTHQIRVHLMLLGHPIAGDPFYGRSQGVFLSAFKPGYRLQKGDVEHPLMARLALHAHSLTFRRPGGGAELTLEAPLPKDFRSTLTALRKYGLDKRATRDAADAADTVGRVGPDRGRGGKPSPAAVGGGPAAGAVAAAGHVPLPEGWEVDDEGAEGGPDLEPDEHDVAEP